MKSHKPKNQPGEKLTKLQARQQAALTALYHWERNACSTLSDGAVIDRARFHHGRLTSCQEYIETATHEAQLGACLDILIERGYTFD